MVEKERDSHSFYEINVHSLVLLLREAGETQFHCS